MRHRAERGIGDVDIAFGGGRRDDGQRRGARGLRRGVVPPDEQPDQQHADNGADADLAVGEMITAPQLLALVLQLRQAPVELEPPQGRADLFYDLGHRLWSQAPRAVATR